MKPERLGILLFWLCSLGATPAEVLVRYDANPAPVSPSNYVFNATSWIPSIASATGITNSPVTNDLASGFNAWNTSDNTAASGSVSFTYPITNAIDSLADVAGWRLRARVRMVSSFGSLAESCFVEYGTGPGNPRFLIFFGTNGNGNLTADLQGLTNLTLTTGGQGTAAYHLHEIIAGTNGSASYYFDGTLLASNWNGFTTASAVDGVRFGTGSTAGKGSMNYNLVEWEVLTAKPSVTTLAATNPATYIATLSANLNLSNAPATAWFEWGATTNYGNTTAGVSFGAFSNAFNFYQSIAGLSASNTYHFRGVASNALGISFGQDASFTTPMLFSATTLPVSNPQPRRATLSGAVNPSGLAATAWFEWGTTTNYGNVTVSQSAGSGTNSVNLSQLITGLVTNTTYHYRCVASNAQDIVFGQDVVFTDPPVFIVTSLLNSGAGSLRECISNAIAGETITFGITGTVGLSSDLLISKNLKITGSNPSLIGVSGNDATRVFTITNGVTVDISGLGIRNGRTADGVDSTSTNSPGGNGVSGAGIFNRGTLNLSNCLITANTSGDGGNGKSGGNKVGEEHSTAGGDGGDGGGIFNVGTLTLIACTVSGNAAGAGGIGGNGPESGVGSDGGNAGDGGGIYNNGVLTVTASTLSGNSSGSGGRGGLGGRGGGPGDPGGAGGRGRNGGHGSAIYNAVSLSMTGSTVSGNTAGRGGNGGVGASGSPSGSGGDGGVGGSGAIYSSGVFAFAGSTISGNSAGAGGTGGNSAPSGNGANGGNGGDAGGVLNTGAGSAGSLRNTLVAMNAAGSGGAGGTPGGSFGLGGFAPDLKGAFTSEGYNLVGKNDGNASFIFAPGATGDLIGSLAFPINPLLGPLANHGGPTLTLSLLPGSPARDAGDDLLTGLLTVDQRGYPRLSGSHVDIGAFEVQVVATNNRPVLVNPVKLGNDTFQFGFTNVPGAEFTVLTSTNVSLPLSNWTVLSGVIEISPGQFQFTDPASAGTGNRFYLIRWP